MPGGAAGLARQSPRRGPSGRRAQRHHPRQRRLPLTGHPRQPRALPTSRPCPRKAAAAPSALRTSSHLPAPGAGSGFKVQTPRVPGRLRPAGAPRTRPLPLGHGQVPHDAGLGPRAARPGRPMGGAGAAVPARSPPGAANGRGGSSRSRARETKARSCTRPGSGRGGARAVRGGGGGEAEPPRSQPRPRLISTLSSAVPLLDPTSATAAGVQGNIRPPTPNWLMGQSEPQSPTFPPINTRGRWLSEMILKFHSVAKRMVLAHG